MVYVRNFTLQKYIFPAKFTNVKWLFFYVKNRRFCNYLRIKRLFGLLGIWVTRWQPFLFQSSLLFCTIGITPDTQRYNFFMNEQKGGAFFIIAG